MSRILAALLVLCALVGARPASADPIPIKVVIVTTFEHDYDNPNGTGESDGEASRWIQRLHLDQKLPFPAGFRPLHLSKDGVLEIMTGMATARAAASIMALGLDPRFDLSHAYWLLAGTAGIDPLQGSQGSAAWAEWVVDGDLDSFIDPREIPPGWPDGHIPWDKTSPFDPPGPNIGQSYHLDPGLVHWAFAQTKATVIPDTPGMKQFRSNFSPYPLAVKPPFVLIGDNLCSATYWQGTLNTEWARRWVKVITQGAGTFVTASCEDAGFMQSMTFLSQAGKVDLKRALILRTASDYCLPKPGVTSAQSLQYGTTNAYMAEDEAFESAYVVGSVVVKQLLADWPRYRNKVPSAPAP